VGPRGGQEDNEEVNIIATPGTRVPTHRSSSAWSLAIGRPARGHSLSVAQRVVTSNRSLSTWSLAIGRSERGH
jgi:hypothetical protein